MIDLKGSGNINQLLAKTIRDTGVENMGIDLRDIGGAGNKEEKVRRIAVQFEEMLVNTLLKEAFEEEEEKTDEDSGLMAISSDSYKDIRMMFLSQYIADSGGLGYRQVIEEQILEQYRQDETAAPQPLDAVRTVPTLPAIRKIVPGPVDISDPVTAPVSSDYGWRKDPIDGKTRFHTGIDFEVPPHTPVKSFMDGEVTYSGWEKGYGYLVEIVHPDGYTTRYGHNAKLMVREGDRVKAGDIISLSGSTGRSTGPHLHFEVRKGEFSLDPARFLGPGNREMLAKLR